MSPTSKINVRAKNADVIEGMRVCSEWLHALEADDSIIVHAHGNMENVALFELREVRTLGFDGEECVEYRKATCLDDGVENAHDSSCVTWGRISDYQIHWSSVPHSNRQEPSMPHVSMNEDDHQ